MPKRDLEAGYYDDKDVFDMLSAARQRLTPQKLVDVARRRGLILSAAEERDTLVEEISRLPFGWSELKHLVEATDTKDRAEKMASRAIAGDIALERVQEAAEALRDAREANRETYGFSRTKKALCVRVQYSEMEPGATRVFQRTQREFTIEFEPRADGGMLIRHHDQPRAREILDALLAALLVTNQVTIELAGVADHALRTDFFLRLTRGVNGFQLEDVKGVRACPLRTTKPDGSAFPTADDERFSSEDVDVAADADDAEEIAPDQGAFVAYVKEIALKGEGVHKTPQYVALHRYGFFVRSMRWTAIEQKTGGARVEFEAGFENENATGFTYAPRAKFERKGGEGDFKKGKSTIPSDERTRLLRLMEAAAVAAMDQVVAKAVQSAPDTPTGEEGDDEP